MTALEVAGALAVGVAVWAVMGAIGIGVVLGAGAIARRRAANDDIEAVAATLGAHFRDLKKDIRQMNHVPDEWVEEFRT